jgi:tetratricopeptide (TPR) repeat protein
MRVNGLVQPPPPPEPSRPLPASFSPTPAPGTSAAPRGPERTDPRIAYTGPANRKVLDALKKVKRRDEHAPAAPAPAPAPEQPKAAAPPPSAPLRPSPEAERQAASALQIALRMEQGGRLEEAVRYLEKSIAQSPEAPALYNRLAIILMRERADLKRAEALLQKAVDLDPGNEVFAKNLKHVVSQRALRSRR